MRSTSRKRCGCCERSSTHHYTLSTSSKMPRRSRMRRGSSGNGEPDASPAQCHDQVADGARLDAFEPQAVLPGVEQAKWCPLQSGGLAIPLECRFLRAPEMQNRVRKRTSRQLV